MSQQTTVSPPSSTSRLGVDGEDRQEERDETTHFLYSYVFSRSTADSTLSADQVEVFQHANREVGGGDGAAIEVGRRLAQLGKLGGDDQTATILIKAYPPLFVTVHRRRDRRSVSGRDPGGGGDDRLSGISIQNIQ